MTRIAGLTVTRARLRFRAAVRYGGVTRSDQEVGIVRIVTDDWRVGLGEMAGPTLPADLEAMTRAAARRLVDTRPGDVDGPDLQLLGGGVDTALLDLVGQLEGRSMSAMLGGGTATVAVNGLLVVGTDTPTILAARARSLVEAGFGTIKIKRAISAATVDTALHAIRDTVGPGVALRLDLNGDLTEREAIEWLTALSWLDPEYVEQPVAADLGVTAMARVRRSIPMPLAADESVTDRDTAVALLDAGACDVLVVKPSRVGGPRAAKEIAGLADAAGVAVTISTLYDSGIGLAAALHVGATIPGDRAHGLATAQLLESDLVTRAPAVVRGRMAVPAGPGLGVVLDPTALHEALVSA
jgi:L-Ala-D/L-Glu epimerase